MPGRGLGWGGRRFVFLLYVHIYMACFSDFNTSFFNTSVCVWECWMSCWYVWNFVLLNCVYYNFMQSIGKFLCSQTDNKDSVFCTYTHKRTQNIDVQDYRHARTYTTNTPTYNRNPTYAFKHVQEKTHTRAHTHIHTCTRTQRYADTNLHTRTRL